jgi:hypothetical protein
MGITDTRSDPRARRVAAVLRGLGLVLLLVGAAGYLLPAGPVHWTALIPAALGAMALAASTLRAGLSRPRRWARCSASWR